MAAKADNIFVRAKAYHKLHPRTPWPECIQKVKGKKVSGTKKKVGAAPKRKPAAKVAGVKKTTAKRVGAAKPAARKVSGTRSKKISGISKASKIVRDIEKLEIKRKQLKSRELKDILQLEINACHDQLDALKKSYHRKSA